MQKSCKKHGWRITAGNGCMKDEATGASLQSAKFRPCLSFRPGDIHLKRDHNYRGKKKKSTQVPQPF